MRINTVAKPKWQAIVYGRRSNVEGEQDRVGVEKQLELCTTEALERGAKPITFTDARGHRSGRHEHTRKGWMAAKAELNSNPHITHFVVYELDRANRSVKGTSELIELCQRLGVVLISIEDRIDTSRDLGADEIAYINLKAALSQRESDKASERQKRNVKYRKSKLIYWGSTPFGTLRVGVGMQARMKRYIQTLLDGRTIDHGATVARLFELYAQGYGFDATAKQLNDEGYQHIDRRGQLVPFKPGAIQSIAWNPLFYAGYIVVERRWHSKHSKPELSGEGTLLQQMATAYGAQRSPAIEAIISDEIAVQAIHARLTRRRTGRSLSVPRALLTPILYTHDGLVMRSQHYRAQFVYRTRTRNSFTVPISQVDEELLGHLDGLKFPQAIREELRTIFIERDETGDRERARERTVTLKRQMARLKDLYITEAISREEFDIKHISIRDEMQRAEALANNTSQVDEIMAMIEGLGRVLRAIPLVRCKRALQHMFDRIELDKQGAINKLYPAPWAQSEFGLLTAAIKRYQSRPRQDLNPQHTPSGLCQFPDSLDYTFAIAPLVRLLKAAAV